MLVAHCTLISQHPEFLFFRPLARTTSAWCQRRRVCNQRHWCRQLQEIRWLGQAVVTLRHTSYHVRLQVSPSFRTALRVRLGIERLLPVRNCHFSDHPQRTRSISIGIIRPAGVTMGVRILPSGWKAGGAVTAQCQVAAGALVRGLVHIGCSNVTSAGLLSSHTECGQGKKRNVRTTCRK